TGIVDDDDVVDEGTWDLADAAGEGPGGVVSRQHHRDPFAVDHDTGRLVRSDRVIVAGIAGRLQSTFQRHSGVRGLARRMIISMIRGRPIGLTLTVVVAIAATVDVTLASRGRQAPWVGVLEEHPAIQYASRPPTERVARVDQSLAQHGLSRQSAEGAAADRTFQRDQRTGH